jgi:hypothetical protein
MAKKYTADIFTGSFIGDGSQLLGIGIGEWDGSLDGNASITGSLTQGVLGNIASGTGSHAEGWKTVAQGLYSHAEGAGFEINLAVDPITVTDITYLENSTFNGNPIAVTTGSLVFSGNVTGSVTLPYQLGTLHVEDVDTAIDVNALYYTTIPVITSASYSSGLNQTTFIISPPLQAQYRDVLGNGTIALGRGSHAEGFTVNAYGNYSHAEGDSTIASGSYSHAEGDSTVASGYASHAEGYFTTASGYGSHAEGNYTQASGDYSHAEGRYTTASGENSHAEGSSTTASAASSHAEGWSTIASGDYSHAEGYTSIASGESSHAEGNGSLASAASSHAEGQATNASGEASHAEGLGTVTSGSYQHAQGQYNISSSIQSAFIHGNGTSDAARSNLLFAAGTAVQITGSLRVSGSITGSLLGTSSFATQALSASFAISSSRAVSSSFTVSSSFATTASYALQAFSASYADVTSSLGYTPQYRLFTDSAETGHPTTTTEDIARSGRISLRGANLNYQTIPFSGSYAGTSFGHVTSGNPTGFIVMFSTGSGHNTGNNNMIIGHVPGAATSTPQSTFIAIQDSGYNPWTDSRLLYRFQNGYSSSNRVSLFEIGTDYIRLPLYTSSRNDSGSAVNNFLFTDSTGVLKSRPISAIATFPYTGSARITGSLILVGPAQITGSFSQGAAGNVASGSYSHAEGNSTISSGSYSHAEGNETIAQGLYSHAEGFGAEAIGVASHAEGFSTDSIGSYSHAEGFGTEAVGDYSHAEGAGTIASGSHSHAEGSYTQAFATGSHAEGWSTIASGEYSHAEGNGSLASGEYSHAEGQTTVASGLGAHAEGLDGIASGSFSHAEGAGTVASGVYSHAEGTQTTAFGEGSHAEGNTTYASGSNSHAEGLNTLASGVYSHAEGDQTVASGLASHAEGLTTLASGVYSHAEGLGTKAVASYSHAEGYGTVASGSYQHVQGQYNISSSARSAFIVGNGTSDSTRSNLIFASGSQVEITGSLRGQVAALSIASNTASIDLATNNFFTITLVSGSTTHISASNIQPGQTVNIKIVQSSVGTGSIKFNSAIKEPTSTPYIPTALSNSVDIVSFISFDSTAIYATSIKNLA